MNCAHALARAARACRACKLSPRFLVSLSGIKA